MSDALAASYISCIVRVMLDNRDNHPLRQFRKARGLSQEALARELGVSVLTVYRWERGSMPRRKDWRRIREATGINPEQFVGAAA